jgi:predicted dehydrogenase
MTDMKALLRFPGERKIALTICPVPAPQKNHVLVRTSLSVISPGTEFNQARQTTASLLQKAWQRPDLVALTLKSVVSDGAKTTTSRVQNRLSQPLPMGYCAMGRVEALGAQITEFNPGQRVAIAGMGKANHAEWNTVPKNLACPVPDAVSDTKAAFATLYALALHAMHQGNTSIGHRIAVVGAGLIGQLVAETGRAAGAIVDVIEPNPTRRLIAQSNGAANCFSTTRDAPDDTFDAVYICANGKGHHRLIDDAARICRDRGTIVCVGDVAVSANRNALFEKEIAIKQVRSYGPGRYDPNYEGLGVDYPIGHVRWTIKRNMAAALDLMADGRLDPTPLITSEIAFADIADHFAKGPAPNELATLVRYAADTTSAEPIKAPQGLDKPPPSERIKIGLLGTGNYVGSSLVPIIRKRADCALVACCSKDGFSAMAMARKIPELQATTAPSDILGRADINSVIIATHHDSHAQLATLALAANKHIWLEKPIAIDQEALDVLREQAQTTSHTRIFMVGHNRRYSKIAAKLRNALPTGPQQFRYRVRFSRLPAKHWLHHADQGGRAMGEITHFIDLIKSLATSDLTGLECQWLKRQRGDSIWSLHFADGSRAVISYQQTTRREPKEVLEVDAEGFDAKLTDWRKLQINGKTIIRHFFGSDKGQSDALDAFARTITSAKRDPLIPGIEDEIALMSMVLRAAQNGSA